MARLNVAPTKSALLAVKEQLSVSLDGYDLLDQKREILVMELLHMVERVKLLEREIDKAVSDAYPALKKMLLNCGSDQVERIAHAVHYDFALKEKDVVIGGAHAASLEVTLPRQELFYSYVGTFADTDEVAAKFFSLLSLLTEMASIRTIAWRLAKEVKKTQRRVNALSKMIIPEAQETKKYIESVLEERERENIFVLKALKRGRAGEQSAGIHSEVKTASGGETQ